MFSVPESLGANTITFMKLPMHEGGGHPLETISIVNLQNVLEKEYTDEVAHSKETPNDDSPSSTQQEKETCNDDQETEEKRRIKEEELKGTHRDTESISKDLMYFITLWRAGEILKKLRMKEKTLSFKAKRRRLDLAENIIFPSILKLYEEEGEGKEEEKQKYEEDEDEKEDESDSEPTLMKAFELSVDDLRWFNHYASGIIIKSYAKRCKKPTEGFFRIPMKQLTEFLEWKRTLNLRRIAHGNAACLGFLNQLYPDIRNPSHHVLVTLRDSTPTAKHSSTP